VLRTLANTRAADAALCGQKAARLGELVARRYRVPPSLIITATRFDECLAVNGLDQLRTLAAESVTASPQRLIAIEEEVTARFERADLPREAAADIDTWLQMSAAEHFAVRSSATNEDLPGVSFAGQYRSFLNVERPHVSRMVVRCFASIFAAGAALYRRRKHVADIGRMAVLVQELVQTDHAGVVFTQAPNRQAQLLIECAAGLGVHVVSGSVSPNRYYLNRTTLAIEEKQERFPLDLEHVRLVARQALAIEREFGGAQNVEYGVCDSSIYILQARPASL
jgi:pyruvate,water dikinase